MLTSVSRRGKKKGVEEVGLGIIHSFCDFTFGDMQFIFCETSGCTADQLSLMTMKVTIIALIMLIDSYLV